MHTGISQHALLWRYPHRLHSPNLLAVWGQHAVSATHEASIERDQYGVPHIYGETDADAAFGLAYAQAEDSWPIMEGSLPFSVYGRAL